MNSSNRREQYVLNSRSLFSKETLFYELYFDYNICITNFLPFIEHRNTYILLLNRKHKQIFNDKVLERCCFHQQPHGIVEEYYPTYPPQIRKRIFYKNGKEDGLYEEWYDATEQSSGTFGATSAGSPRENQSSAPAPHGSPIRRGTREAHRHQANKINYASNDAGANSAPRRPLRGKLSKDGKEDGLSESWYDNTPQGSEIQRVTSKAYGQQKFKTNYKKGKKDGLSESWHENGQQCLKRNYKNGKEDGLCESWHETGQQQYKINYKKGNEDGLWEGWYENGQQKYKKNYKKGNEDGLWEGWYENGQQKYKKNYKNGKNDGLCEGWYENGQQHYKYNYKNGKEDGLYESWYDATEQSSGTFGATSVGSPRKNGQQEYKINYASFDAGASLSKNGKEDGLYEEWYSNGQQASKRNYKKGEKYGLSECWYNNGQQASKYNYKSGKEDGLYEVWYENGQQSHKGNYKNGKEDGLYESWYENQSSAPAPHGSEIRRVPREAHRQQRLKVNFKNGEKDGLYEY